MYYYLFNFIGLFFCLHRSHHRRNHLFLLYNFSFSRIIFFGVRFFCSSSNVPFVRIVFCSFVDTFALPNEETKNQTV